MNIPKGLIEWWCRVNADNYPATDLAKHVQKYQTRRHLLGAGLCCLGIMLVLIMNRLMSWSDLSKGKHPEIVMMIGLVGLVFLALRPLAFKLDPEQSVMAKNFLTGYTSMLYRNWVYTDFPWKAVEKCDNLYEFSHDTQHVVMCAPAQTSHFSICAARAWICLRGIAKQITLAEKEFRHAKVSQTGHAVMIGERSEKHDELMKDLDINIELMKKFDLAPGSTADIKAMCFKTTGPGDLWLS